MSPVREHLRKVLPVLKDRGILLESDSDFPSVSRIIAGEKIRGSWWGHPAGKDIYNTCEVLADHRDVLRLKFVKGKVTYVHRKLWSHLLTVATAKERWQVDGLSDLARTILIDVERAGGVRVDQLQIKTTGPAIRELETRLLILTYSVHTESGAHTKGLESWSHWMGRKKFSGRMANVEDARSKIENVVNSSLTVFKNSVLPWPSASVI